MGMLTELVDYLETLGLSLTEGTNIFKGVLPSTAIDAGSLVEYDGLGMVKRQTETGSTLCEMPRLQLMWRSTNYETGMAKIRAIWKALHTVSNTTIGSTFYQRIESDAPPFHMGKDENGRYLFAVNFTVTREAS
jgi:hypothetical protein